MNLTITQDNTRTETINSSIIDKLYEIAFAASSDPNSTVSLTGRLESPKGYAAKVEWLNTEFSPNLTITVPTSGLYILFEDSAIESLLISGGFSADGTGISLTDAANATFTHNTFRGNTTITSFNEFPYFTKANTNPPSRLFEGCSNLKDIDLTSTTVISLLEFFTCSSLTGTLSLPSLTSLGQTAFDQTGITSITDLGSITSVPDMCFLACGSLTTVTLPNSCINIDGGAFGRCNALTSIDLGGTTYVGIGAFQNDTALTTVIGLSNLTSIMNRAFLNCPITGPLSLPNLTSIEYEAFNNTRITSITDLGSITAIPDGCFDNCVSLTTVPDLSNLTSIMNRAFKNCPITGSVSLPNLVSLGSDAFNNTRITSITDLGTISSIPSNCFYNCTNLTSVTLPSTCLTINAEAFRGCSSLTTLNAQNVKTITGYYTFGRVAVSNLALPAIETIGQRSLSDARIAVLDLGPNLSSIGGLAFWDSTYTTFIFRGTTVPTFNITGSEKFLYNMNNVTIYVPESALSDYQTAWPQMASNMVKIEGSVYDTQS